MEESSSSQKISTSTSTPQVTLLIENPRKSNNWGPLLRCCAAFGIPQIFVVGFDKCNVQGSHGASKHVEMIAFPDYRSALQALQSDELNFELIGVLQGAPDAYDDQGYATVQEFNKEKNETTVQLNLQKNHPTTASETTTSSNKLLLPKSFPVHCRPFAQNTCLVVGKKSKGLTWTLAQHCQKFVHIPHQGLGGGQDATIPTPFPINWLTMEAGVSIVLHEFAAWAGYNNKTSMTSYQGQKYQVQHKAKGSNPNDKHEQRKQRQEELQNLAQETEGCLGGLLMMGDDDGGNGDY